MMHSDNGREFKCTFNNLLKRNDVKRVIGKLIIPDVKNSLKILIDMLKSIYFYLTL